MLRINTDWKVGLRVMRNFRAILLSVVMRNIRAIRGGFALNAL
jgi:hypothetical protein